MPSLNSLIDATYKSPTAKVRFNGSEARNVISVTNNQVLDGAIGSCAIRLTDNPGINPEARVTASQGYDGLTQLVFTGYVDTIERSEIDGTYTFNCRDVLKKALDTFLVQEVRFGQDLAAGEYYYSTYTSAEGGTFTVHQYSSIAALNAAHPETTGNYSSQGVKAEAVVQWLLHMSGLQEGSEIQVDETNFWIGDLNPAKFHLTSVYDAAMQIANLIGWRIYADQGGVARFKRKPRQPGGYTFWRYTDRESPYNIHKLTRTQSNIDLRNYVEVRGASGIKTVLRASSPFIGNTPYRGVLISEELIDTQGIADFIAARVLGDLNRLKVTVVLEADGNPFIAPGSTLDIRSETTTGKYLAEQVQTNMTADGGYRMTVNAAAYLGDTKFEEDPEPDIVASFVPTFVSVLGDPKYVVEFDGAGSYSSRGVINNYFWNFPDGSTKSSSESSAFFVFDSLDISNGNSQDVTLTVTDSAGNTASATSGITVDYLTQNLAVKYRHLYGALTTQAVGSLDGGQSWTTSSIPAISVAASNFGPGGVYVTSGYALFGTSDGKIYKTVDSCATMVLRETTGGEVTDIHVPELDSSRAVAVTNEGKVYLSIDYGETWSLSKDFAFSLRQAKMGYTDFDYIQVVGDGAGNVYETFDGGSTWNRVPTSLDVLWATDGSITNYYAHTSGVISVNSAGTVAMPFDGGSSPSVPNATVMIDDDTGVMLADGAGQHWVATSGTFYATQNNSANLTQHMLRDGEMAPIVYYATASGISKSINRNQTIMELFYPPGTMPTGGWGQKVAYGPLAAVVLPTQLLFRGGVRPVGDTSGVNGLHLATASGWEFQYTNTAGSMAVAPGGVAIFRNGDNEIDWYSCIPSSGITAGAVVSLVKHEDWNTAVDTGALLSFTFSKRADARDMIVYVADDVSSVGASTLFAASIPDFTSVEDMPTFTAEMESSIILRDWEGQSTTSVLGDLVTRHNYTLFGDPVYSSILFRPDGTIDVTTNKVNAANGTFWTPFQKSSAPFKGFGKNPDGDFVLITGHNGTEFVYESTNVDPTDILGWNPAPFTAFTPAIYGSFVDQSKIFFATDTGVFEVDGYGSGEVRQIFDVADYNEDASIVWMTVNGKSDNSQDYIALILDGYPNVGISVQDASFYSVDSGLTWIEGPRMLDRTNGHVELWVLDPVAA